VDDTKKEKEEQTKQSKETTEPIKEKSTENLPEEKKEDVEEKVDKDTVVQPSEKEEPKSEKLETTEPIQKETEKEIESIPEKPKEEPKKQKDKKKQTKKDEGPSDDFQYIIRLSNTDVNGEKTIIQGLTSIKGIGRQISAFIIDKTKIDPNKKAGNLKEKEIEILQNAIDEIQEDAPAWMLNHRNDYETGEDIHLIGSQIDMKLRDEINNLKKIRCYRGIRHEQGLPARGQRTRANNRRGTSLGVSKKRVG
jgi:small subunit ribosomal protein S13